MTGSGLQIAADIYELSSDQPRQTDTFLVDTNIWIWLAYTRQHPIPSRRPSNAQRRAYPDYVKSALAVSTRLVCCTLSLSEIATYIEHTELCIFNAANRSSVDMKSFRAMASERQKVLAQITSAFGQVRGMGNVIPIDLNPATASEYESLLQSTTLGGYDPYLVIAMRQHNIKKILTDDRDFATVSDIEVFTSNNPVVTEAQKQHRLKFHR